VSLFAIIIGDPLHSVDMTELWLYLSIIFRDIKI